MTRNRQLLVRMTYRLAAACCLMLLAWPAQADEEERPAKRPAGVAPQELSAAATANKKPVRAASAGDTFIAKAHAQSTAAISVSDYTQILELCQRGIHAGVSEESDGYTRRLMSWAYNRRGELLSEQGHDTLALVDFEAAIQNDKSRWRAYHNRGVSLALVGKHRDAIADFNRTVEINPRFANAYFNRGEVFYELGELESAIRDYTRAIKLQPDDAAFHASRGHTYHRLGQYREAAHDYTVGLRLDGENAAVRCNRGDLYAELGYYKQAVADYQEAVRSDSKLARAYLSSAWMMATCIDVTYRSVEGSLDAMTQAAKLGGQQDHRFLDILAAVQANAGNYNQARQTLEKALETAPEEYRGQYATRLDLYEKRQPFRVNPRPLPEVADRRGERTPAVRQATSEAPE